jgi:TPP-dependent trihydroxycyclohexane-1,2-dione (THcHDO) dehydratase
MMAYAAVSGFEFDVHPIKSTDKVRQQVASPRQRQLMTRQALRDYGRWLDRETRNQVIAELDAATR